MSFILGTRRERRSGGVPGWNPTRIGSWETTNPLGNVIDGDSVGFGWSLQKAAIWGCVTLTATIAEILPVDVFSGQGTDKRPRPTPTWLADLSADGHGLSDWCFQFVVSSMLRGNVYARILERDRNYSPNILQLVHPDAVQVRPGPNGGIQWWFNGAPVDADTVWHKRFFPVPGQVQGMSPIAQQAGTVGLSIAAQEFGRRWFTDGAHPSGMLVSDQELDAEQALEAKKLLMASIRGTREPLALGGGWHYETIQINPEESQFLQTQQFTAAECCRIFGPAYAEVFGYETGGSLTYSNVEQRSLDLLTYAVDPWLVRLERALSALLPAPQYVKFNRKALVRSDLMTRFQAHQIALQNRWATVNEVRDLEDMAPVPWGDEPNAPPHAVPEAWPFAPTTPPAPVPAPTPAPAPKKKGP